MFPNGQLPCIENLIFAVVKYRHVNWLAHQHIKSLLKKTKNLPDKP